MGAQPDLDRQCVRFGVFELNTVTGELRKHGVRVRLQDQPLKLLRCLLEAPGVICSREDLIRRIWPEGTFVDYERGLNAAVTRLRLVLADSADTPRYVETVGRKGYRFIAPVETVCPPESAPAAVGIDRPTPIPSDYTAVVPQALGKRSRLWRLGPYAAVLTIGFSGGAAAVWWRATRPVLKPLVRLSVELGAGVLDEAPGNAVALSPDGTRLAVVLQGGDGKVRLATRRLDESQLAPLAGTEGAGSPFFSPDGQWIAFFADSKLKKIAVQGGATVTLAAASANGPMFRFPAGSWGHDGNIIAMLDSIAGLARVPSDGGSPAPLIGLKKGEDEVDNWPQVLPGSQAVLFTRHTGDYDTANIEVFSFHAGVRKTVLHGGFFGRYLPSGHLVYIHQNTLFAAPFDLSRLAVTGVPQPVLEDIGRRFGWGTFDFSQTGSFVYSQPGNPQLSIFWVDQTDRALPVGVAPGFSYEGPHFSPDGKRLAFSMSLQGHQDIWVQDLDRGAASRLTSLPGVNDTPVWTTDGWNLIFRSTEQPNPGLYGVRTDGSGEPQRLSDLRAGEFPYSVSPDGKWLVIWDRRGGGKLSAAPIESGRRNLSIGKAEPFLQKRSNFSGRLAPAFSPDGRWVAYCSNESGRLEVYVVPFPGPGGRTQVSTQGGKFPIWSRNARELFFLDLGSSKIMVTTYKETGDSFLATKPQVWSRKRLLDIGRAQSYDLAPDGKRFAAVLNTDGTAEPKPTTNLPFLLNFFDELCRRVPRQGR